MTSNFWTVVCVCVLKKASPFVFCRKKKESHTGLERHESEYMKTEIHFGVKYSFKCKTACSPDLPLSLFYRFCVYMAFAPALSFFGLFFLTGWCHRRGCRMSVYGQTYTPQPEHSLSLKLVSLLHHHVIFTPAPSPVFTLIPTHFLFFSLWDELTE